MIFETWVIWAVLAALVLDAMIGDPDWLWRRLPHPVVVMGRAISWFERRLNREELVPMVRRLAGAMTVTLVVGGAGLVGWGLHSVLVQTLPAWAVCAIEAGVMAVLIAQKSLHDHVADVRAGFETDGLDGARAAVSRIVGRDPQSLDGPAVVRASVETTAENFSDGVVAPAFWAVVGGLPGILAYKALNTADSMIGHRSARYEDFGWAAARADDIANLLPARLSGLLIVAGGTVTGFAGGVAARGMWRDAGKHRSLNAGWPEAAMAGALGIALAGPRQYGGTLVDDPWLNPGGERAPQPDRIDDALRVLRAACGVHALAIAGLALFLVPHA